jgi:hypothetical protein
MPSTGTTAKQGKERMYLDPGSTSLFVQALFAVLATMLATFSRSRAWFSVLWLRLTHVARLRRRPPV